MKLNARLACPHCSKRIEISGECDESKASCRLDIKRIGEDYEEEVFELEEEEEEVTFADERESEEVEEEPENEPSDEVSTY